MHSLKKIVSILITATILSSNNFACTGLTLKTTGDNSYISGRTLEFGKGLLTFEILAVPNNFSYSGTLMDNQKGLKWTTKYKHVGFGLTNYNIIVDGINEQGLSSGMFYFPGFAKFQNLNKTNKNKSLSAHELVSWILGNCATVEEVKQKLPTINVIGTELKELDCIPPLHFNVNDKNGHSIVIEYTKGKLTVYDNPIGVLTNSPSFDWHLTNLRNFVGLKPTSETQIDIDGLKLSPFGNGSGAFGLPGDFTPPSRFIRASFFKLSSSPSKTASQAVKKIFHILNQFDIPDGANIYATNDQKHTEITLWTSISDLKNLKYYFHTYNNRRVRMLNLKNIIFNKNKILRLNYGKKEEIKNITGKLK